MGTRQEKVTTPAEVREEEILTPEEVAAVLRIGRTAVFQLLAEKAIPSFTVGRLRRVRRADLLAFVERRVGSSG